MNQRQAVLDYIQENGWIDFLAASQDLGISQLTGRIAELRGEGWTFDKKTKTGKNRYGNPYQKVIYYNARKP